MSAFTARLALIACILTLPAASASAQSTGHTSAKKEGVEGDPNGSIRSLGAAGFNDRGDKKPPAVVIPPLNEGPSGTSGPPRGTVPSSPRR